MDSWTITLKNDKSKGYNRLSFFILIIDILALLFVIFFSANQTTRNNGLLIIAAASVLLGGLYFLAKKKWVVELDRNQIIYPSFPKKNIDWKELRTVILKDELLTIDFKNSKIIQQYIEPETNIDEKAFNEFCKKQLTSIR